MPTDLRFNKKKKKKSTHPYPLQRLGLGFALGMKGVQRRDGGRRVKFFIFTKLSLRTKSRRRPQTWWKFPLGLSLLLTVHSDLFHGSPLDYKVSFHVPCAKLVSLTC